MKQRTKQFTLRIFKVVAAMPITTEAKVISYQIAKSGSSVGANYRAACRARSNKEFIAKLGVVLEEADETAFWLEIITESNILPETKVKALLKEAGGQLIAQTAPRLPNTCSVQMPGVLAETQVMALDLAGFAISAGSACSSGKVGVSHVLKAMGLTDECAQETIRISLCPTTTDDDIMFFGEAWKKLFNNKKMPAKELKELRSKK